VTSGLAIIMTRDKRRRRQTASAIFFDLDGTLCDSLPGIVASIRAALPPANGKITTERIRSIIGPPISTMFRRLIPGIDENEARDLEAKFRSAYDGGCWREFAWYAGVEQTISSLHSRGFRLFVFTNKPQAAARRMIESSPLSSCFEAVVTKDSKIPPYESKTEMLRDMLLRYKVDTRRALVVGDGEEDLQAARELQLPFVFAEYGYGSKPEANGARAGHINQFQELVEICNRGF
jgi:phosphoglycolate phosphatase